MCDVCNGKDFYKNPYIQIKRRKSKILKNYTFSIIPTKELLNVYDNFPTSIFEFKYCPECGEMLRK